MPRKAATKREVVATAASFRPKREVKKPEAPKPAAAPKSKRAASKSPAPKKKAAVAAKGKKKVVTPARKKNVGANKSGRKTLPPYAKMIAKALTKFATRGKGVALVTIVKFISENYPVKDGFKRFVKTALSRGLDNNIFSRNLQSYRLTTKGKSHYEGKKKSTTKKTDDATPAKEGEKKRRTTNNSKKAGGESPKKRRSATAAAGKEAKSPEKKKRATTKKAAAGAESPKRKKAAAEPKAKRVAKGSRKTAAAAENDNAPNFDIGGGEAGEGNGNNAVNVNGSKFDHFWQFRDNDGTFGNYDVKASDVLEEVYQGYLANRGDTDVRAVKSGQWEYQVDFMAMKQTNIQHPNHTVRDIRRVPNNANPTA